MRCSQWDGRRFLYRQMRLSRSHTVTGGLCRWFDHQVIASVWSSSHTANTSHPLSASGIYRIRNVLSKPTLLLFNRRKGYGNGCTTAIFTMCYVYHRAPPSAVAKYKTCTVHQWNWYQDSARIQDQSTMCWQHTKHFDLSHWTHANNKILQPVWIKLF